MSKEAYILPTRPYPVQFRVSLGQVDYTFRTQFREILVDAETAQGSYPEGGLESGIPTFELRVREATPTFLVSDVFTGYTGHLGDGSGMRDSRDSAADTVWGTATAAGGWITADLGEVVDSVDRIEVRPIPQAFDNWGAQNLNGAILEVSVDGITWTQKETLAGCAEGALRTFSVREVVRYVRLRSSTWLAIGDFHVYREERVIQPPLTPSLYEPCLGLMSYWVLDIGDFQDSPLITGIPLTTGLDLVWQYAYLGLGYQLVVQCKPGRSTPTYESLGVEDQLILVRELPEDPIFRGPVAAGAVSLPFSIDGS